MLTAPRNENSAPYTQVKVNFDNKSMNQLQLVPPEIDLKTGLPRKICPIVDRFLHHLGEDVQKDGNLLCNACGLYQKLHKRPRPLMIREDGSVQVIRSVNSSILQVCQNCKTTDTPIWRRSPDNPNQMLCNACALYYKNHNSSRPPSYNFSEDDRNLLS